MTTVPKILKELEKLGTAQNRKTYGRHGVTGEMFGVSYANLKILEKRLKKEGSACLASELWAAGNHDGCVLAAKIADPTMMNQRLANQWVSDVSNRVVLADLSTLIAQTPFATKLADQWIAASPTRSEMKNTAGWSLIESIAAKTDGPEIPNTWFSEKLKQLEADIVAAPNYTKYTMAYTLIALGSRTPALRKSVETAAKRIGKIEVDHGETSCKTPEAIPYLAKVWARKK